MSEELCKVLLWVQPSYYEMKTRLELRTFLTLTVSSSSVKIENKRRKEIIEIWVNKQNQTKAPSTLSRFQTKTAELFCSGYSYLPYYNAYRPECYCLSRHVLAVLSFPMRGIILHRFNFRISDCFRQRIGCCQSNRLMCEVNRCGARNTCFYFIVVLFYSTGQSS